MEGLAVEEEEKLQLECKVNKLTNEIKECGDDLIGGSLLVFHEIPINSLIVFISKLKWD